VNKQEQHETMTSRITRQNAISWQQFTERDREQRNAVSKTTAIRNEKESNDTSYEDAPTPRSERYKRWIAAKSSSSETAQAIRKCVKIMTAAANTKQTKQNHAQRKAAANEPEITPIQPEVLPKQKKEQRTDYWTTRDDKRRQSARLLKLKRIEQSE